MTDAVEDLKAAARNGAVGRLTMERGNYGISLPPHDQHRQVFSEVEAVPGVDVLAAGVNDGAQRRQEGCAASRVGEGGISARDLAEVRARSQPDRGKSTRRRGTRLAPRSGCRGDEEIRAWERGGAQDAADLPAEAAA